MTPLSYLSVLRISGADAGKFLQAQLSAQLTGLREPEAIYSAYCTSKGQVIATLLLSPRTDHWLALVEASLLPVLVDKLQRFILRDDVRLEPVGGLHAFGVDPNDILVDSVTLLEPRTLPIRYAISDMKPIVHPEATAQWRRTELLYGIAWLNRSSSEKYIPQMLGLDDIGAVSFTKGCYPGQEVITRARHLGEVKRRPQVLDLVGQRAPDPALPCFIRSPGKRTEATLVHCVSASATHFTVLAVAALQLAEAVHELEQDGQFWEAQRAQRGLD